MPLVKKLDEDEWALLEVIEDPVWCGEFLRSTMDGEVNRDLWPSRKFKYRDYQRQVLTDTTELIVYTGGRSIGKCQPMSSRVYTTEGYKKISELQRRKFFTVYCLDKNMQLVQRRAICVKDEQKPAFTLITEDGHTIVATENHPILTENGYEMISDIAVNDYIAVTSYLPWQSNNESLRWHELRFLGYWLLHDKHLLKIDIPIRPKTKRIEKELEVIAKDFLCTWTKDTVGNFYFKKKPGPFRHNISVLMEHCEVQITNRPQIYGLPTILMNECLDNLKIFLEALFAQYGSIAYNKVSIEVPNNTIALDIQELLLRFGIETRIKEGLIKQNPQSKTGSLQYYIVELLNNDAIYKFLKKFDLPGFSINIPEKSISEYNHLRYSRVIKKYQSHIICDTYAIHVYEFNNYISENIYVHNSIVLQDKIIHEIVNAKTEFPDTFEETFVTPNKSQQTKIINEIISRFSNSKILKHFMRGRPNKSEGTMIFDIGGKEFKFFFRIAGDTPETNMISLHSPKIRCDEAQLFSYAAYNHLQGGYNNWETPRQQMYLGVSNGLRNTTLYILDRKSPQYKKYRIPSHNNPHYSYEQNIKDIKRLSGEHSDGYQNMVLGRHGSASYQVITRDDIHTEPYAFTNSRYYSAHKYKGFTYNELLQRPKLPEYQRIVLAVDPAYSDSCIMQVLIQDKKGVWRTFIRYRLQRIDTVEQEQIIDWLASYYNIPLIAIDIGPGGQGPAILHSLMHRDEYKHKNYDHRVMGISFADAIVTGYNDQGEELTTDSKAVGVDDLVRLITDKQLIFSEIDQEGISEIERIARKKSLTGKNIYFILGEKGLGKDDEDHIFASFLVFVLAIRSSIEYKIGRRIGKPISVVSNY